MGAIPDIILVAVGDSVAVGVSQRRVGRVLGRPEEPRGLVRRLTPVLRAPGDEAEVLELGKGRAVVLARIGVAALRRSVAHAGERRTVVEVVVPAADLAPRVERHAGRDPVGGRTGDELGVLHRQRGRQVVVVGVEVLEFGEVVAGYRAVVAEDAEAAVELHVGVGDLVGVDVAEVVGSVVFAREDGLHLDRRIGRVVGVFSIGRQGRVEALRRRGIARRVDQLDLPGAGFLVLLQPAVEVVVELALVVVARHPGRGVVLAADGVGLGRDVEAGGDAERAVVVGDGVGGRIAGRVEVRRAVVLGVEPGLLELEHGVLAGRALDVDVAAAEAGGAAVLGAGGLARAGRGDDHVLGRDDVDVELVLRLAAVAVARRHHHAGVLGGRHLELVGAGGGGDLRRLRGEGYRGCRVLDLDAALVVDVRDRPGHARVPVGDVGRDVLVRPLELHLLTSRPLVGAAREARPVLGADDVEPDRRLNVHERDLLLDRGEVLRPGHVLAGLGRGDHLGLDDDLRRIHHRAGAAVLAVEVEVDLDAILGGSLLRPEGENDALVVVHLHVAGAVLEVEHGARVVLEVRRQRHLHLQRVGGAEHLAALHHVLGPFGDLDREVVVLGVGGLLVVRPHALVVVDDHGRHVADGHGEDVLVAAEDARAVREHVAVLQLQGDGLYLPLVVEDEGGGGDSVGVDRGDLVLRVAVFGVAVGPGPPDAGGAARRVDDADVGQLDTELHRRRRRDAAGIARSVGDLGAVRLVAAPDALGGEGRRDVGHGERPGPAQRVGVDHLGGRVRPVRLVLQHHAEIDAAPLGVAVEELDRRPHRILGEVARGVDLESVRRRRGVDEVGARRVHRHDEGVHLGRRRRRKHRAHVDLLAFGVGRVGVGRNAPVAALERGGHHRERRLGLDGDLGVVERGVARVAHLVPHLHCAGERVALGRDDDREGHLLVLGEGDPVRLVHLGAAEEDDHPVAVGVRLGEVAPVVAHGDVHIHRVVLEARGRDRGGDHRLLVGHLHRHAAVGAVLELVVRLGLRLVDQVGDGDAGGLQLLAGAERVDVEVGLALALGHGDRVERHGTGGVGAVGVGDEDVLLRHRVDRRRADAHHQLHPDVVGVERLGEGHLHPRADGVGARRLQRDGAAAVRVGEGDERRRRGNYAHAARHQAAVDDVPGGVYRRLLGGAEDEVGPRARRRRRPALELEGGNAVRGQLHRIDLPRDYLALDLVLHGLASDAVHREDALVLAPDVDGGGFALVGGGADDRRVLARAVGDPLVDVAPDPVQRVGRVGVGGLEVDRLHIGPGGDLGDVALRTARRLLGIVRRLIRRRTGTEPEVGQGLRRLAGILDQVPVAVRKPVVRVDVLELQAVGPGDGGADDLVLAVDQPHRHAELPFLDRVLEVEVGVVRQFAVRARRLAVRARGDVVGRHHFVADRDSQPRPVDRGHRAANGRAVGRLQDLPLVDARVPPVGVKEPHQDVERLAHLVGRDAVGVLVPLRVVRHHLQRPDVAFRSHRLGAERGESRERECCETLLHTCPPRLLLHHRNFHGLLLPLRRRRSDVLVLAQNLASPAPVVGVRRLKIHYPAAERSPLRLLLQRREHRVVARARHLLAHRVDHLPHLPGNRLAHLRDLHAALVRLAHLRVQLRPALRRRSRRCRRVVGLSAVAAAAKTKEANHRQANCAKHNRHEISTHVFRHLSTCPA